VRTTHRKTAKSPFPFAPIAGQILIFAVIWGLAILSIALIAQLSSVGHLRLWLVSRSAALSAYGALTLAVMTGLILSHPANKQDWRLSRWLYPWHRSLLSVFFALLSVHLTFTGLDPKSGVGFGQFPFPIQAKYHPAAMVIGSFSLYFLLLITVTASMRKTFRTRWLSIHRLSTLCWMGVTLHGIWGGTDTPNLHALYLFSTASIILTYVWRSLTTRQLQRPDIIEKAK